MYVLIIILLCMFVTPPPPPTPTQATEALVARADEVLASLEVNFFAISGTLCYYT
jgi:hypothetical protein